MAVHEGSSLDQRRRALRRIGGTLLGGAAAGLATGSAFAVGPRDPSGQARDAALLADGWTEIPAVSPPEVAAAQPGDAAAGGEERRSIRLVNAHTWEKLEVVYKTRGVYIDESLEAISHLMRDHRADSAIAIDPALIDELYLVGAALDTDEAVHILSGYRTPATNARLRRRSSGVAKYSLHMEGRAADIYVPGVKTSVLREAALSLRAGGVGLYSKSGFVHVDTGRVRHWGT